jgi:hypothetical protein
MLKEDRLYAWIGGILVLIMMFVPWGSIGIEPLIFGFMPLWLTILMVPTIVLIVVMLGLLRREGEK